MTVLRIEHPVRDFEGWKKAFDSDPIGRQRSGVLHYRVYRPVDNPRYVIVELEFEDAGKAEETLAALRKLWEKVEGSIIMNPQARILEVVESADS
jgi:hypothetical protein